MTADVEPAGVTAAPSTLGGEPVKGLAGDPPKATRGGYDPCYLKPHYDKTIIVDTLNALRIRSDYDVVPCNKCGRWKMIRRPDYGDAT